MQHPEKVPNPLDDVPSIESLVRVNSQIAVLLHIRPAKWWAERLKEPTAARKRISREERRVFKRGMTNLCRVLQII